MLLITIPLGAEDFFTALTDQEKTQFSNHDIVIRFINDPNRMCVSAGISPEIDAIVTQMHDLDANYLAEVLWTVPVSDYDTMVSVVDALFRNIETFKEIPYYSERHDITVPLFDIAEIVSTKTTGTTTQSTVRFCMIPFAPYTADLTLQTTAEAFLFMHKNNDVMYYNGIRMIGKGKMRAGIAVIQTGEQWIIYAAGGVNAAKPPFMKKRLETAFNNRIKDFASFYIQKVKNM